MAVLHTPGARLRRDRSYELSDARANTQRRGHTSRRYRSIASTLAIGGRSRIERDAAAANTPSKATSSPPGKSKSWLWQTKCWRVSIRLTSCRRLSSRTRARLNTAVVASILGTVAVRTVNCMIPVEFCDPGTVELQFSLRRAHIIATLCAFQSTTTVDSQPAGVVSEDSCV